MNPEKNTQKLFRLWHSSKTNAEIAKELGITASKLTRLAHRHKLGKRKYARSFDDRYPRPNDPSPKEILAGIAAVQADWSEEERLKRYRGKKRVAYIAPTYEYDGHTPTFKGLN